MRLQLIRIRTIDELLFYKDAWDHILASEQNDNPFIEYAWFYKWWQIIGKKERVEVYAVQKDDYIIGFFPFSVRMWWGVRIYSFTGENLASYTGFIVKTKWRMKVVSFVLHELIKKHHHVLFSFHGLLESGPSSKVIEQYFIEQQQQISIFRMMVPYTAIGNMDFPSYLNSRKKTNALHPYERKLQDLGSLSCEAPKHEELWQMFKLFDKQWAKKINTSGFSVGKKREFFEQLALVEGEAIQVKIAALVFENQWIAYTYGICCRGRYMTYMLSHEPKFRVFAASQLMTQKTLQQVFSDHYKVLDMGIDYEPYKLDWHTEDRKSVV